MTSEPARVKPFVPLLDYQRQDVESDARFRWNCWARQTGKSFTKSLRRILRGLARRRMQVFLSAGERQSRELMEKARAHCQALKIATDFCDRTFFKNLGIKQLEIRLPGGVRVIGLPANPQTASGSGDIDQAFSLAEKFRLVFVRCHYAGTLGTADLTLLLDSAGGSAFDVKLFTVTAAGVGKDVHLRIGGDDAGEPSAWTFQPGDQLRVQWTNPDPGNITWGLEVGLALAS